MSCSSRLSASTAALVGLAFVITLTSGCANMPQRRWDGCAIGGGVAGLILGGTAGGVMGTEFQGHHVNSTDRALYAGAGALAGAAIGALAGHYICDPVVEAAAPPPPPPPPPVAEAPPPPPPAPKKIVLRGVHFDFDKAKIRPDAEPILDEAADILKQNPSVAVEVNGYCDAIGTVPYNLKLSQRRSAAVVNYLEGKGIPGDRLEPHGYGKTDFVATNKTADGRAQNRRVELIPKQ
jgi:outer membrane protein OmpA-like peptidoglycan-associated protein